MTSLTPTWDLLDPETLRPTGEFDFTQAMTEPARMPHPPIPQDAPVEEE